ncbi:copper-binding protein [Noviherbaspirillum suwonense]|jgi:Cu(I)/Ag(I) efflux system protein CusF|uniref:Cu and Ag efflux protein CusF n=1 Tax=Noviherbaspirillum suwonense TaxID=1224511 RepID=A0ABY1PZT8_9BURK|nr:copper-binding protein [Noviherbaspirillum suwonense]RYH05866.1 MAG: copper-binding protein [Alphaproteobacteria bacterium]SMP51524.1 Cu and Ag efflux protein CusF [Noviherbaspirillum suwonense]
MKAFHNALLAAALVLASAPAVHAQPASPAAVDAMSTGEVKKVNKATGRITIKHGPLRNLGMDAMTMVFRVQDPAMLDQVAEGDRISFVAEQPGGQLTITRLQKTN